MFFRFGAFPKVFRFVKMDFIFVKMEEKIANPMWMKALSL